MVFGGERSRDDKRKDGDKETAAVAAGFQQRARKRVSVMLFVGSTGKQILCCETTDNDTAAK